MKKQPLSIEAVRAKIDELKGKEISMRVCRGRKQIKTYRGVVEQAFPSVFVVRLIETAELTPFTNPTLSYSYSDVVCGEVAIAE